MEESGKAGAADWEWRWVVDPLDGTTNFLHGIPHWAISVGIEKRTGPDTSEVMAGVIYNPAADEMFWAERGMGAFLNDRRLRGPGRRDLREAVFATGIPFAAVPRKAEFSQILARIMPQVAGVRRFGSAALDLAWTAPGATTAIGNSASSPGTWRPAVMRGAGSRGFATDPEGGGKLGPAATWSPAPFLARPLAGARFRGIAAASAPPPARLRRRAGCRGLPPRGRFQGGGAEWTAGTHG
jgi:myo-inositol-1(or 4)-monophosphatase